MPCVHKCFGHLNHLPGQNGLLPNCQTKTLIVGTFNPPNNWVPNNNAEYFYGRSQYFWKLLSVFTELNALQVLNTDFESQLDLLQHYQIGLTDLLVAVDDAQQNNPTHVDRIETYKDSAIELFTAFTWNTDNIIQYIADNHIQAIFFTKKGTPNQVRIAENTFEFQMREIETYCVQNNIVFKRLHTPTGQGVGPGAPRLHKLIHRWFIEGADQFSFLHPEFHLHNYPFY